MRSFTTLAFALAVSALPCNHTNAIGNYSLAPIDARSTCSAGSIVCNGPTKFALCNPPQALAFQPVAAGTYCENGQIQQGTPSGGSGSATGSMIGSSSGTATAAPAVMPVSSSMTTEISFATITISSSSASTESASSGTFFTYSPASSASPSSTSAASAANPTATGNYKTYTGDGSVEAGWPNSSDWMSFDDMFTANEPVLAISCSQFSQANNSPQENADLKAAISSIASSSGIDPRFVFAIAMQESKGCVRAWQTNYGVQNPGIFQSHAGTHNCNEATAMDGTIIKAGSSQNPCPQSEITGMVADGVTGTAEGDGLVQCIQKSGSQDVSKYYRAARVYNSGSIPADNNLSGAGATAAYASDIANRLTGQLTGGTSGFTSV